MSPRPSSPLKPSATRKPAHTTSSGWGTRRRHRPARCLYPQAIEEIQFSVSPIGGQFWVSLDSPFSQPADDDMPSVPASGTTRLSRLTLPSDRQTTTPTPAARPGCPHERPETTCCFSVTYDPGGRPRDRNTPKIETRWISELQTLGSHET